ncbi:MAG: radical SAM family heme chaperone HemW [Oscillospiraceae bacterium]
MYRGLYIHVPFCIRKCPYCDFYSVTETEFADDYIKAVVRNIKAQNVKADTVYFGGGTPSLLSAKQIYSMLSAAEIAHGSEITMECNPNSVDEKYLADIYSAGVNRISFGVQSLSDKELSALGRLHNAETAVNAVNSAYKAGFRNISADLMLAMAYQTKETLAETIDKLVKLPICHVSAYMLKIEEGTAYGKSETIQNLIPNEDETADMYLEAVQMLEENGFAQYEISNFSHKGFESRHNLKYWRCEEYYGIGPSAHSYVDGMRKACPPSVERFVNSELQEEIVTEEDGGANDEKIMLALRLTQEGILLSALAQDKLPVAKQLEKSGLLRRENERIMLTPNGCLVSNEIICRLT